MLALTADSAVYLTGSALVGLGNVALVPMYTRYLTPKAFGVYVLLDVIVLMLVTLSALKLDVSYLKWFSLLSVEQHSQLLGSTLLTGLIASLVCGVVLFSSIGTRFGDLLLHYSVRAFAWMLLPIVVVETLHALLLTHLRAQRRARAYSIAAVLRLCALLISSYLLLVQQHAGLRGLFLGRLIGDCCSLAFLAATCLQRVKWGICWSLVAPMLRFGLPLIWSVLAVMLQDVLGRYFLSRHGTLEQVGLLGAAIKVAAVFQLLVAQPFSVAWGGVQFQFVKHSDGRLIYSVMLAYVCAIALSVTLVLTICAPTLLRIFTAPPYFAAAAIFPMIVLARAASMVEQPASTSLYVTGKTGLLGVAYTVALLLDVLLLRVLGVRYGLPGVAWAWALASASVPLLFMMFGQRRYRLSFNFRVITFPLAAWILYLLARLIDSSAHVLDSVFVQGMLSTGVLFGTGVSLLTDLQGLEHKQLTRDREISPNGVFQ